MGVEALGQLVMAGVQVRNDRGVLGPGAGLLAGGLGSSLMVLAFRPFGPKVGKV